MSKYKRLHKASEEFVASILAAYGLYDGDLEAYKFTKGYFAGENLKSVLDMAYNMKEANKDHPLTTEL